MPEFTDTSRLSLNQYTTFNWSTQDAIEGCAKAGLNWIGLWRDKVAAQGLASTVKFLGEHDVKVSSLCRGGFFPAATKASRQEAIDDNKRAIDECVALGTDTLVLVCGGIHAHADAVGTDIDSARQMVYDGIAELIPYAQQAGVKLGIEALHPMYAADRNVIVTLGQANDFAMKLNGDASQPAVGVIIDCFHVWWD
ncbi:MAG: sugar phosphate isomerase/epimerase family protein, partial [Deinococcota bacterium]